ncbi:MAG TPA: 3-hydroxyacyl-CoA dehydrogenase family protein [Candidatus Bathyarchaeia archaeon]|nr:3-hydroxyacyl-CoA dehydrogenase family protein [Candidatus Bathyarchaeia archaeon]
MKHVTVLGAGLMGHGISQVFAESGKYDVTMRDVEQRFIDNGMKMIKESLQRYVEKGTITEKNATEILARIHPTLDLNEAFQKADLIIEAVTENPELKKEVIAQADNLAPSHAIIASNTSTISITKICSATARPEKVCGMHFFNPPQLMKLIEIIRGEQTSDETIDVIRRTALALGKEPVVVNKDSPGFIVNRILIPALNEAAFLVENGVAKPEDIDKACVLGLNWPMGPLKLLDYIGIDTIVSVADVMAQESHDRKFLPNELLRQMVNENRLGRKTGKGFYNWIKK